MSFITSVSTDTVLVVAPPTPFRQGLLTVLQDTWPHLALTITADPDLLPRLVLRQPFALILLDSTISDQPLTPLIRQLHGIRQQQVLVLAAGQLPADYQQDLLHLETPSLLFQCPPAELIRTIQPWLSGATGGEQLPSAPQAAGPSTPFSRRELDVLRLIISDCSNQEIAQQLCLSVRTVESHRRAMLHKVGARTLIGLVVKAAREGWLPG